jgi:plastocyanin
VYWGWCAPFAAPFAKEAVMRRRLLLLAAVLAATLVAAVLAVPAALAGGYCHKPATDERGTTVTMRDYCFSPTVLRVPTGGQVTFVNRDEVAHPTVGRGSDWGVEGGVAGRAVVRFDEPGIYPYFCHEHIGMIGVVVVGDGHATATAAPARVADPPAAQPAAGPVAAQRASWSLPVALLLVVVLAGAAVVLVVARRRRASTGPAPQA